jgi:hypothetical protein
LATRSLRFVHWPEEQNLPVLLGENESRASGALPPEIAAMILSSWMLPVPLTVIHGYFLWKPTKACW